MYAIPEDVGIVPSIVKGDIFAGCQQQSGESSSGSTGDSSAAGGASSGGGTGEIETIEFYGFGQNPSNAFFQWQQDYFAEKIGVNVTIIPADNEKLQTMLSAGNLPDMGTYAVNGDLSQAIQGGHLMDLTPYEDKIPAYTEKWPESVQFSKDYKSAGTGKLYGLIGQLGVYNAYAMDTGTYAVKVRWDIYEKAGKPEVTDMYSLLEAAKKMKEVYPKTADGLETYMFGNFPSWDGLTMSNTGRYQNVTGIMTTNIGYNFYDMVNDKIDPILSKDGSYYQALKWMATANQMGLVDPDSMTQTYDNTQAKYRESEQYFVALPGNYVDAFNTEEHNNAEDPKGFMPLVWKGQAVVTAAKSTKIGGNANKPYSISADTKKLDACLKFANLLFDEEAMMNMYGGPQGELWDIKDGKYVLTEKADSFRTTGSHTFSTNETAKDWWGDWGIASSSAPSKYPDAPFRITDNLSYVEKRIENNKIYDMYEKVYGKRRPIQVFEDYDAIYYNPDWTKLIETMPTELEDIQNNVKGVVTQYSWQIVMNAKNDAEVEKMFDQMVSECEALGVKEVVDWGVDQINKAKEAFKKYE